MCKFIIHTLLPPRFDIKTHDELEHRKSLSNRKSPFIIRYNNLVHVGISIQDNEMNDSGLRKYFLFIKL